MYNRVILTGRVGTEPECAAPNRPVTFSLATWENFKDEEAENGWRKVTTWHDIVVWGREDLKKYYLNRIEKGAMVQVEGKIDNNIWEDEEGNKRKSVRIKVDSIKFMPKPSSGDSDMQPKQDKPEEKKDSGSWGGGKDEEDDLPF